MEANDYIPDAYRNPAGGRYTQCFCSRGLECPYREFVARCGDEPHYMSEVWYNAFQHLNILLICYHSQHPISFREYAVDLYMNHRNIHDIHFAYEQLGLLPKQ